MQKNIIILGPPGSGKGTQAQLIAKKYGLKYFGIGDLMRMEAESGSVVGKKIQEIWDQKEGKLIPDEIAEKVIKDNLEKIAPNEKIVFDGYPRTLKQAIAAEKLLGKQNNDFIVIDIEIPNKDLISRMSTRRICENCGKVFFQAESRGIKKCDNCGGKLIQRQEDQPDIIHKRLEVYDNESKPIIEFYKKMGNFITIDGRPPIEEVEKEIDENLKKFK